MPLGQQPLGVGADFVGEPRPVRPSVRSLPTMTKVNFRPACIRWTGSIVATIWWEFFCCAKVPTQMRGCAWERGTGVSSPKDVEFVALGLRSITRAVAAMSTHASPAVHCSAERNSSALAMRFARHAIPTMPVGWRWLACVGHRNRPPRRCMLRKPKAKKFHVFWRRNRPRSQGATLTGGNSRNKNFPPDRWPTMLPGHLMASGAKFDLVIVARTARWGRTGGGCQQNRHLHQGGAGQRHGIPF